MALVDLSEHTPVVPSAWPRTACSPQTRIWGLDELLEDFIREGVASSTQPHWGKLAWVGQTATGISEYGFDAAGNRTALTEGDLHYTYAYELSGRLKKATDGAGRSVTMDYDLLGRRTKVLRPNGVASTWAYDAASQLLAVQHAKGTQVLAGFAYEYDEHGRRVSKTSVDGTVEGYTYDSADRLTEVRYGTTKRVVYGVDAWGNRTGETEYGPAGTVVRAYSGSHNAFNQLTTRTQSTPSYLATTYAYSPTGNLLSETTGANVRTHSYDLDGRLRQVTLPGGAVHSYEYDASGLRTKQTTPSGSIRYLLDGASVMEELDVGGATTASYLPNPQVIDEVLSFATGGQTYYPLVDGLGSVVAVTDFAGAVVRTNSYEVYGARSTSGAGPDLAYGFTGREHDSTGLNYHRDRYMDPTTGRWGQSDRAGFVDGPNLYQYAKSSPIQVADPEGLQGTTPGNTCGGCRLTPDAEVYWELQKELGDAKHHLARITYGEAGGQSYAAKVGVASVVVRRINSSYRWLKRGEDRSNEFAEVITNRVDFNAYRDSARWFEPDEAYRDIATRTAPSECAVFSESVKAAMEAMFSGGASVLFTYDVLYFGSDGVQPRVGSGWRLHRYRTYDRMQFYRLSSVGGR